MTEAKHEPMFPTTEGDLWRSQHDTMSDLLAFVDEHAPNKAVPLPVVPWHVGPFRTVSAEVGQYGNDPSGARADRPGLIAAYAAALGVEVKTVTLPGKVRYHTTGRIGRREGTAQEPRTTLHISADVWDEDDEQPSGGSLLGDAVQEVRESLILLDDARDLGETYAAGIAHRRLGEAIRVLRETPGVDSDTNAADVLNSAATRYRTFIDDEA